MVSSLKFLVKCIVNVNSFVVENYYVYEYFDEEFEWSDEFDYNVYYYVVQNFLENEEWDDCDFVDEVWDVGDIVKNF